MESITPERYYELDSDKSNCMLGTSEWWYNGFDGWAYDAALIDGGIREDHIYLRYRTPPDLHERPIFKKTPGYSDAHGTLTAGIIASSHSTYSGVAFGLDALFDARGSNLSPESTLMENIDWVLDCPLTSQSPEVVNNSYGLYYTGGEFGPFERFLDAVVDDLFVSVTKSAGNEGVDAIGYPQSHNLISVANLDINDTCITSDDVITRSSSRGPTASGRRKPDITAPGHNTYTTSPSSIRSFANHGGTSAAAPHVAGAVILMEDGGIHDPMAIKAILLNTATTWSDNDTLTNYTDDGPIYGDRWDRTYGWGVMDLYHSFCHRNDWFSDRVIGRNDTSEDDDYKLYKGHMSVSDKATLVWNRRAVYNGDSEPTTYYTLTDLNLCLYDENDGSLEDWDTVHSGNNVHQVSTDIGRDVVIKVYSWSRSIRGADSERYVLATEEEFQRADPPSFDIDISMPSGVFLGSTFNVNATVTNNGDVKAHNNRVTLNLPTGFTLVSGSNPQNIGGIEAGNSSEARWRVRAPSTFRPVTIITVSNSSRSYCETYTGDHSGSIRLVSLSPI